MSVTQVQIELVRELWARVVPSADEAVRMFYERLFELDPGLRELFKPDLTEQRHKLATMLGTAVNGLNHRDALVPAVQALGERHVGYGVKPADYDTVGAALLWTLEHGLGSFFTTDVRDAWAAVYGLLAATMQETAVERAAGASRTS